MMMRQLSGGCRSAVQDRLSIEVWRKEEEIVDVGLPVLAAAVRQQRAGILQLLRLKPIDGDHIVVLQEEAAIRLVTEEFEDRSRRFGAMAILRLDQEDRLAAIEQLDGAIENIQFVPL